MKPKLLLSITLVAVLGVAAIFYVHILDRTPPNAPLLVEPVHGQIVEKQSNINFLAVTWYEPEGQLTYDLQIASEPQFTNLALSKTKLPPASIFIGESETLAVGTYYVRVRAVDQAGNVGPWSDVRMFTVQAPAETPSDQKS